MKALIAIMPGSGHFNPMIPLARELTQVGHTVAFACAGSFVPQVQAAGFQAFPVGADWHQLFAGQLPPGAAAPDIAQLAQAAQVQSRGPVGGLPHMLGRMLENNLPDLLALLHDWQPDVVAHGPFVVAAGVASEVVGVPHAVVGNGLVMPRDRMFGPAGAAIAAVLQQHNLPHDPELRMLERYLYLSLAPPTYQGTLPLDIPTLHHIRPVVEDRTAGSSLPGWLAELPDRPTVYVTFGTVFNQTPGLFETILVGLRDQPLNLVLTVGQAQDPAQFGPQPAHVRIERYIPMSELLPHCAAVVTHGGFNTVMTTLAAGLPLLVVPVAADQPFNAARCAELGVGLSIAPNELDAAGVGAAVHALLEQPGYRAQAQLLQREIAALPGPDHAAALLVRLAAERQPLLS